jgi:hypothetical protein
MIPSLLIAAPVAFAIGLGTVSWLRRSPQSAVRRLVVVNLAVGAGAIVILGAMAFGLVDPAQAAGSTASTHSGSAFIGAGIAIAGSARGLRSPTPALRRLRRSARSPSCSAGRW